MAKRRGSRSTTVLKFPLVPRAQPRRWKSRARLTKSSIVADWLMVRNYNTARVGDRPNATSRRPPRSASPIGRSLSKKLRTSSRQAGGPNVNK